MVGECFCNVLLFRGDFRAGTERGRMETQLVVVVLGVVLLVILGTVFAAWRSERDEDPPSGDSR